MLSERSIQVIDLFKKPETKDLVFASNNWDEFSKNITQLGSSPENNKKKGDVFELLTSLYFVNNPIFSSKLVNLWHHTNVPNQIFDCLDLQKRR